MSRSRRHALLCAAAVAVAPGCVHWDLQRNAPGHVDLGQPPGQFDGHLEKPGDPGERAFVVSGGPVLSLGMMRRSGPDGRIGAELSFDLGWESNRHWGFGQDGNALGPLYGRHAMGLDLGATFVENGAAAAWRDVSVELHLRRVFTYAAGAFYDPASGQAGALATFSLAGLFLRAQERFDGAGQIILGLAIKPQMAWVWSQ